MHRLPPERHAEEQSLIASLMRLAAIAREVDLLIASKSKLRDNLLQLTSGESYLINGS